MGRASRRRRERRIQKRRERAPTAWVEDAVVSTAARDVHSRQFQKLTDEVGTQLRNTEEQNGERISTGSTGTE